MSSRGLLAGEDCRVLRQHRAPHGEAGPACWPGCLSPSDKGTSVPWVIKMPLTYDSIPFQHESVTAECIFSFDSWGSLFPSQYCLLGFPCSKFFTTQVFNAQPWTAVFRLIPEPVEFTISLGLLGGNHYDAAYF